MTTNLNLWLDYIGQQSVPLFKGTVETLLGKTKNENITCKELADTIIHDASLTTRLIIISNSVYYNRTQMPVHDIRRAVLLIGFNKIYEICLTSAIVETLIRRSTCRHVYDLTAQSFCAAVYANAIAEKIALHDIDELFVSALLWNYGEIAFWSLSGQAGDEIANQLRIAGRTQEEAQRQLLGITFKDLTAELCKKWNLTKLLSTALSCPGSTDKRIRCIKFGHELAKLDIDVFAIKHECELIKEVSQFTKQNHFETIDFFAEKMQEAKQITLLHLSDDLTKQKRMQYPGEL